ncbi:MAG: hypothetical protein NZ914_14815 [Gemmatales bacterium]|nr:hypothetical protein [Gemmatales bacterium]
MPSATLIADINPTGPSVPQNLVTFGSYIYFTAEDSIHGRELWRSDGTAGGTTLVADLAVGSAGSNPQSLTPSGGWLYFTAYHPDVGVELWRTNGTVTQLVEDINPGTSSSNPSGLTNVQGTLFFAATRHGQGTELWRTTATGALLVSDLVPGPESSAPNHLTNVQGILFFTAWTPTHGRELWKSDGTSTGTQLVADINQVVPVPPLGSSNLGSDPQYLVNIAGTLYFSANDGLHGKELWKTNGTSTGTLLVADIVAGPKGSYPAWLTNVHGTIFFSANAPAHGRELWRSDGFATGTQLVRNIHVGTGSSYPQQLVNAGGLLYFVANDGNRGHEVWRSDGTSSGTFLLRDIRLGFGSSYPADLRELNGGIVFTAEDGIRGRELWRSLGQPADTFLLDDVLPGSNGSQPAELTNYQGKLLFRAQDDAGDLEPYVLDTTATAILSVIGPNPRFYKRGDLLEVRVILSNPVRVNIAGGTPAIALQIGSRVRLANYIPSQGSNILVFRYQVRPDDLDLDSIRILSPILLRGSTILGPAHNPIGLTFSPPDTSGVLVDGVAPRIRVVQGPRPGIYRYGDILEFSVLTSEPIYWQHPSREKPYLEIIIGRSAQRAYLATGDGTDRLVFRYRIQRGDNAPAGIWLRERIFLNGGRLEDAAGNLLYLNFPTPNLRRIRIIT